MIRILIGFLPWILYFFLIGTTQTRIDLAVIVAYVSLLTINFKELKKGFILTWVSMLYFSLMLILVVIFHNKWIILHTWILSNATLASIAWLSLMLKNPFTLQYAKEQVDQANWRHPIFVRINQILSLSWAIIFTLCMGLHILQLYLSIIPSWLSQTLTNGLSLLGVFITVKFPKYYRRHNKYKLKHKTGKNSFSAKYPF